MRIFINAVRLLTLPFDIQISISFNFISSSNEKLIKMISNFTLHIHYKITSHWDSSHYLSISRALIFYLMVPITLCRKVNELPQMCVQIVEKQIIYIWKFPSPSPFLVSTLTISVGYNDWVVMYIFLNSSKC